VLFRSAARACSRASALAFASSPTSIVIIEGAPGRVPQTGETGTNPGCGWHTAESVVSCARVAAGGWRLHVARKTSEARRSLSVGLDPPDAFDPHEFRGKEHPCGKYI